MRPGMRPRGERPPAQETPKQKRTEEITTDVQNGPPIFEMAPQVKEEKKEQEAVMGNQEIADTLFTNMPPDQRIKVPETKREDEDAFAKMLDADVETLNARIDAEENAQTPEPTSMLRSVWSGVNKMRHRLAGLFGRRETRQQPVEVSPKIDPEKRRKALELKVQLPEQPTSDEIREAMVQLIGNLPELRKLDGTFSDQSSIMKSLAKEVYEVARSRVDAIVIQDVLREQADVLQAQYPERKELYDQLDRLARALGQINNLQVKRGQMVGNTQIAHGILKNDTISRRAYDKARGVVEEVKPIYAGEVTFTEEERQVAREAMPEVVKAMEEAQKQAEAELRGEPYVADKIVLPQKSKPIINLKEAGTLQPDGSLRFTDAERQAAREQMPEVARLHDDIELTSGDDDLGTEIDAAFDAVRDSYRQQFPEIHPDEIEILDDEEAEEIEASEFQPTDEVIEQLPDTAIEPLEERIPVPTLEKPVEHVIPLEKKGELVLKKTEDAEPSVKESPKPLSVRQKHGPVTQTSTMEQRRNVEMQRVRAEIARIQEQIAGKEKRLSTTLQWWKLGESSRIARKATKEAITKLQEQLRAQNWALSDLFNAPKIATQDEMSQYPRQERQKKQAYAKKTEDFQKRTGRRAS